TVTPDQAFKLKLVQNVRVFARDRVHLTVGSAYTRYEDNAGGTIAYAVAGARQDRLEPYKWSYPIIGEYEAKGFFDRKLAQREADKLAKKGYDVSMSEVEGFSTMGFLPDPIRASNLTEDEIDLATLVFHELTHSTIFKANDTQFSESMATFVGRTAALRYFEETFGADSKEAAAARTRMADLKVLDEYVTDLFRRLGALYDEAISREEKLARRQMVFE